MTRIRKKSSIMIIIVIILILLLSSGGFYTRYLNNKVKLDPQIINKLGIVRGSIQRLVKLELNNIKSDELIDTVNFVIKELRSNKIIIDDKNYELSKSLEELNFKWKELKTLIDKHRETPSRENKNKTLDLSEEIWHKADDTVLLSQLTSEKKVKRYKITVSLFIVNLFLGLVIIYLIKRYVKDTLEYLVNYDGLTNIYNRRYFNDFLKHEIDLYKKSTNKLSLIMLDIDNFKSVNDIYGHDVGDYVLKKMCDIIKIELRRNDVFARVGGEEFAIITPNTNVNEAKTIAEKVRKTVEKYNFKDIKKVTISLGVTEFIKGDDKDTLYKRVDIALYKAKNNGKNKVEIELKEETYPHTP